VRRRVRRADRMRLFTNRVMIWMGRQPPYSHDVDCTSTHGKCCVTRSSAARQDSRAKAALDPDARR
jgi:hypothetical protein